MEKIKILFFIPTLGHGGAERVLINLVNHMDQDKFDITVQTMFDVGIYQIQIKEGIRYIGGHKRYFRGNTLVMKLLSPKALYKHFIKEDYDIIVSYLEGPSARAVAGCINPKTKLICWIHTQHQTMKFAAKSFRNAKESQYCYGRFDKIVGVSKTVMQDFQEIFHRDENICVVYNTIESDVIMKKSQEAFDDFAFSEKEINLISVGKLIPVKGYDRLVNITKRLKEDGFPVHTYIVGKGEEKAALEKQIAECGIESNWTFVGFQSNPYKYVKAADLYVCSSRREGFSTAVTESLIIGTPVVSTNCSGAYELLGYNNEYGIVTENEEESLYQGIKRMLEGDNLAYYKQKAQERGGEFNAEKTVQSAENMFKEVFNA